MSSEVITTEQCMTNGYFQNWLVKAGFMQRVPFHFMEPYGLEVCEGETIDTQGQRQLISSLVESHGYIVPKERLARLLYGDNIGDSEFTALWHQFNRLKHRLARPLDILNFRDIGWAVGVEGFLLNPNQIRLCHLLWLAREVEGSLSTGDLSGRMYGATDKNSRNKVKYQVHDLRDLIDKHDEIQVTVQTQRFSKPKWHSKHSFVELAR